MSDTPQPPETADQTAPTLIAHSGAGAGVEREWGPYTIVEEIGSGGMAMVYRARHSGLQREFALKVIRRAFDDNVEALARFRLEAQAAAALGEHPGIVAAHDVGEAHGRLYLVMDLVEGRPLDEVLQDGDFDHAQVAQWCADAARAVHHAHTQGVLHRDLKPANLLVGTDGAIRLTDFGLARLNEPAEQQTRLTQAGALLGTPQYMPPEQARGEPLDRRADVYSLGATLYHALARRAPFVGDSVELVLFKVINELPSDPRKLAPAVPAPLVTIALRCLEKLPEDRYQTAEELADDLERFVRGERIAARRRTALSRSARWLGRHAAAAVAVTALIGAAVIGAGALYVGELRARADAESQAARTEAARSAELQRRVAARPHADAARDTLARMDRLRMTTDWDAGELAALGDEAREQLAAALDLIPDDPALQLDVARSHHLAGDTEAYAETLDRLLEHAPEFGPARLARAIHRLDEHEALAHRRKTWTPEEEARAAVVRAAIDADLEAAERGGASETSLTLAGGMRLFVDGRYEPAAERLAAAAKQLVSDAHAWYWAGHAWAHVDGHTRDALAALNQALRFRPRHRAALRLRAVMAAKTGNTVTARKDREVLAEDLPDRIEEMVTLAKRSGAGGDHATVLKICNRILELDPEHVDALSMRSISRMHFGAMNDALADLNNALRLDPKNFDARCQRAVLRAQLGDTHGGLEDVEQAIAAQPGSARGYAIRGMVYLSSRQFELAVADYDRALQQTPDDPQALHFRALARDGLGDFAGAVRDYEAALAKLRPDTPFHRRTLSRLETSRAKAERR